MTRRNVRKQGWVFPSFSPDSDDRLSLNFHRFFILYSSWWYTKFFFVILNKIKHGNEELFLKTRERCPQVKITFKPNKTGITGHDQYVIQENAHKSCRHQPKPHKLTTSTHSCVYGVNRGLLFVLPLFGHSLFFRRPHLALYTKSNWGRPRCDFSRIPFC